VVGDGGYCLPYPPPVFTFGSYPLSCPFVYYTDPRERTPESDANKLHPGLHGGPWAANPPTINNPYCTPVKEE